MGDQRPICKFWQKGMCKFGNRCSNAHGYPNQGGGGGGNRNNNNPNAFSNNAFGNNNNANFGNTNNRAVHFQNQPNPNSRNPFGGNNNHQQQSNWNNNNFNNNFNNNNRGGGGGGNRGARGGGGGGGGGNHFNNNNNNNRFAMLSNGPQGDPFAPSTHPFGSTANNNNNNNNNWAIQQQSSPIQNPNPFGGGGASRSGGGPFRNHPPSTINVLNHGGDPFGAPSPFMSHGPSADLPDVRMSAGGVHVSESLSFRESQPAVHFQSGPFGSSSQSVFGRPAGPAFANTPFGNPNPSHPGIIAGPNTYVPPPVALNIQLPASDEAAAAANACSKPSTSLSAEDIEQFKAPAFTFGKIPEVEPPPELRA